MRPEVEVIEHPAIVEQKTWLVCEEPGCDFRTDDERKALNHHARTHAVRATKTVGDRTLRWFDTEKDAKAWFDCCAGGGWGSRCLWYHPGWYVVERSAAPDDESIDLTLAIGYANELVGYLSASLSEAQQLLAAAEEPLEKTP